MIFNAEKDAEVTALLIALRGAGETPVMLLPCATGMWVSLDGDALCVLDGRTVEYNPADGYSLRE